MIMRSFTLAAMLALGVALAGPAGAQGAKAEDAKTTEGKSDGSGAKPTARKAKGASTREPSPRQLAARERQRKCSAEWKEAKKAGTVEAGMRWPKYWSRCNARLKGGTA